MQNSIERARSMVCHDTPRHISGESPRQPTFPAYIRARTKSFRANYLVNFSDLDRSINVFLRLQGNRPLVYALCRPKHLIEIVEGVQNINGSIRAGLSGSQ